MIRLTEKKEVNLLKWIAYQIGQDNMNNIEVKDKEVFIPSDLRDSLNIRENYDIEFKFVKEGMIIKFHERKDKLKDMIGIVKANEPTNAIELKKKGQKGEYQLVFHRQTFILGLTVENDQWHNEALKLFPKVETSIRWISNIILTETLNGLVDIMDGKEIENMY